MMLYSYLPFDVTICWPLPVCIIVSGNDVVACVRGVVELKESFLFILKPMIGNVLAMYLLQNKLV